MTKWIIKNKDPILVTVIFGIFLEFGRCLFPSVVDFFSSVGVSFIDKIIDVFYRTVSSYSPLNYSYSVIHFFAIVFFSMSSSFFISRLWVKRRESVCLKNRMSQEEFIANYDSFIRKLRIVMLIFSTVFFLFINFTVVVPGMYYSKFDRSMTIIRPYITDTEYDSLKSRWLLMKSKNDYNYIDQRIREIKETNNLKK